MLKTTTFLGAITFRVANSGDDAGLRSFISEMGLPSEDVESARQIFIVAFAHGALQGSVGLESFGSVALLRSLAVREDRRGAGLGSALFERALELAATRSVAALYLLTTSTARFFARRGFETVDRASAPEAIQDSRQFADLCPTTATCMVRRL